LYLRLEKAFDETAIDPLKGLLKAMIKAKIAPIPAATIEVIATCILKLSMLKRKKKAILRKAPTKTTPQTLVVQTHIYQLGSTLGLFMDGSVLLAWNLPTMERIRCVELKSLKSIGELKTYELFNYCWVIPS